MNHHVTEFYRGAIDSELDCSESSLRPSNFDLVVIDGSVDVRLAQIHQPFA